MRSLCSDAGWSSDGHGHAACLLRAAARGGEERQLGDEEERTTTLATNGPPMAASCSGLWEQRPMLSWNYRPGQSHKP